MRKVLLALLAISIAFSACTKSVVTPVTSPLAKKSNNAVSTTLQSGTYVMMPVATYPNKGIGDDSTAIVPDASCSVE